MASPTLPILILSFLLGWGVFSMWGLIRRNGYYRALCQIRDFGPFMLPGSEIPLVRVYTGIRFFDYPFCVLQCFFASVFDGSDRALELLCLDFAGTIGALLLVVGVEAQKKGHEWHLVSFSTFWGFSMQCLGFGIAMPIYCLTFILTATTTPASRAEADGQPQYANLSSTALTVLPWSFAIGYVLPTALMSSPYFSDVTHQYLVALWQCFPLWMTAAQVALTRMIPLFSYTLAPSKAATLFGTMSSNVLDILDPPTLSIVNQGSRDSAEIGNDDMRLKVRSIYRIAVIVSALPHQITIAIAVLGQILQTPCASLFDIYVPVNPFRDYQITSYSEGVRHFLQWDFWVGSVACLVWALWLQPRSIKPRGGGISVVGVLQMTFRLLIYGPGAVVPSLAWDRWSS